MCLQAHYCSRLAEIIRKLWEKHFGVKNLIRYILELKSVCNSDRGWVWGSGAEVIEKEWYFPIWDPRSFSKATSHQVGPKARTILPVFTEETRAEHPLEPTASLRHYLLWRTNITEIRKMKRRNFFTMPWQGQRYIIPWFSFPFGTWKGSFFEESGRITEINSQHTRTREPAYGVKWTVTSHLYKRICKNKITVLIFYKFLL